MTPTLRAAIAAVLFTHAAVALGADEADAPSTTEADVIVIGSRDNLQRIPGAAHVLEQQDLEAARAFTVNEALRKVPGVYARDEEGFGLRPNLGIRGLNPTRSTKVLLLEDGLPLTYAPYGDNASYYHPPIERFERIEVLKGSGQIAFGPQTVGGIINYITPRPPEAFGGYLKASGGSEDYRDVQASIGDTIGDTGFVVNATHKETDGAREHMHFEIADVNAKLVHELTDTQTLTVRASYYDENSDVPYSGLTLAEYQANPRANPFVNDEFAIERFGGSVSHRVAFTPAMSLTTSAYYTSFERDWWRQSSNSGQRPNDASDPTCGGMQNLLTTCGNEGRLREYWTAGLESRLNLSHTLFGLEADTDAGVRWHQEDQQRLQVNSDSPTGRTPGVSVNGGVRENSDREVQALSGFVQTQLSLGQWTVTPGVRFESIDYERTENLTGLSGEESTDVWIPGLGVTYALTDDTVVFAGAHRGFSPPVVTDVITSTGGSVELDAETSWNYELGVRSTVRPGVHVEATAFRMDFENQVVSSSLAANACGASVCNAGETLHQGAELFVRLDSSELLNTEQNIYFQSAYTWVEDAEFRGARTSNVTPGVPITGNRLPYSPEHLLQAAVGVETTFGMSLQLEAVYNDEVFTDDLNTVAVQANGQRGLIPSYTIWNATVNYALPNTGWTMFVTGKNLADKDYVVDMSRGMIPGMPRLVYGGVSYAF